MKLIVDRLDMAKTSENWPATMPFAPAMVKRKNKLGGANWFVAAAAINPGVAPQWAYTEHDEYVRVPLFQYTLSPAADLALAFVLQLGLSCAGYLPGVVTGFYVVTGTPVELLYDADSNVNIGLKYWVGFAVLVS